MLVGVVLGQQTQVSLCVQQKATSLPGILRHFDEIPAKMGGGGVHLIATFLLLWLVGAFFLFLFFFLPALPSLRLH